MSSALIRMTIQEASDMPTSRAATALVTKSPCAHRCIRPNWVSIRSYSELFGKVECERRLEHEQGGLVRSGTMNRRDARAHGGLACGLVQAVETAGLEDFG